MLRYIPSRTTCELLSNRGNPIGSHTRYDPPDRRPDSPTESRLPLRQVHVLQSRPSLEKIFLSRKRVLKETIPLLPKRNRGQTSASLLFSGRYQRRR